MAFWVSGTPETFERTMNVTIFEVKHRFAFWIIDYIVVLSRSLTKFVANKRIVSTVVRKAKGIIEIKRYRFLTETTDFLRPSFLKRNLEMRYLRKTLCVVIKLQLQRMYRNFARFLDYVPYSEVLFFISQDRQYQ